MANDISFKHPFTPYYRWAYGAWKVNVLYMFSANLDTLCTELNLPGGILWCYSKHSAVPEQLAA